MQTRNKKSANKTEASSRELLGTELFLFESIQLSDSSQVIQMKSTWFLIVYLLALQATKEVDCLGSPAVDGPAVSPKQEAPVQRKIDFTNEIKPILAARCYECHGPDKTKSGLRLDRRDHAMKGGDSGLVILAGNHAESLVVRYVTGANESQIVMPPKGDRLSTEQIDLLKAWINQGASWPADTEPDKPRSPDHWSFKPPQRPLVPSVQAQSWGRNPIDAFVLARLERENVPPANVADRSTLIHRLSLDLLGLPPTRQEVSDFVSDEAPAAYDNLINRLLASPHFGERWGRHWLDLARYADSDGYEDDKFRPDAWRFRDWVVDAYNRDMPFDQFTLFQLAGDLLPGTNYEQKLATGFHRMTLSNNAGAGGVKEEYRVKAVKDRINTTGTVWLGLSFGCAECHSHKYDPLSQREYYELYAFFNNLEDTGTPAPPAPARYVREHEEATRLFNQQLRKTQAAVADYENKVLPFKQQQWEETAKESQGLPESIQQILVVVKDQRTRAQRSELTKYFRAMDSEYARLKMALFVGDEVGNNRPLPPSDKAIVIAANLNPRKSYVQKQGDFLRNGVQVEPATPAFLPPLQLRGPQADRLDLATWIVDPRNPLASRVAVNQIWQHLFGQGLVPTVDNFGVKGDRPSHPELLDWLATEFIARGWSRKAMIRLVVSSSTYRQSSQYRPELIERDPSNTLLARQNRLRLEAECIRDVALAASGLLNPEVGGPSFQPPLPTALSNLKELKNERFMEPSPGQHRYRRGVYVNVQRTFSFPMLMMFDGADANVCCVRRDRSNTPLQALTLMNDPAFFETAQALGRRVLRECEGDFAARIDHLYQLCLARPAQRQEVAEMEALFSEELNLCRNNPESVEEMLGQQSLPGGIERAEAAAWIGLARTVINLDEFITRQ